MNPLVLKNNTGIKGFYQFFNKKCDELIPLLDGAVSDNLIVDAGLNAFKSFVNSENNPVNRNDPSSTNVYDVFRRVSVGTGTAVPTVADTNLQNVLATKTVNSDATFSNSYSYDAGTDSFTFTHNKTVPFPLGGVIGNISEVGVFGTADFNTVINTMFSRALILDNLGNPTTITLTADDQLVVSYTYQIVIPRTISFNFTYQSVSYTLEGKLNTNLLNENSIGFHHTIGSFYLGINYVIATDFTYPTATTGGTSLTGWTLLSGGTASSTVTPLNPANARKRRVRLPLAAANFAEGIKGFSLGLTNSTSARMWLFKFTPNLPKTANDIVEIEFATDFVRL